MAKEYVTFEDGRYRIAGSRIALQSLVRLYREGLAIEAMVHSYPTLTLEQIMGSLAFYLANKTAVDCQIQHAEATAEAEHAEFRRTNAEWLAKMERAREEMRVAGSFSS